MPYTIPGKLFAPCFISPKAKQVVFKDSDFMKSVWGAISSGSEYFLFGCVYRSPNSSDPNNEALLKLFYEIENSPHTNIFIVGDFNLPKIDWDIPSVPGTGNKFARDFVEVLQNLYLSQLVEEPTRMRDGQKSNVLDLVITNQVDMVDCLVISPPIGKSDHMVLDFRLFLPGGVTSVPVTERFAFFIGDYESMRKHGKVKDMFVSTMVQDGDVNTDNDILVHCLEELTAKFIPKVKARNNQQPLWMNNDVRQAIKCKHKAWNRFQKSRSEPDRVSYNIARNEATDKVNIAKKSFERKLTSEIKSNPKSFWRYVQSKNKFRQGIGDLEKPDGTIANDDADKAETLNLFFASVFTKEDLSLVPALDLRICDKQLDTVCFNYENVKKAIMRLDQSKSPGPDNIHNRILKELMDDISRPLAHLFNKSMASGVVCDSWKEANVTPILRKEIKRNQEIIVQSV